MLCAWRAESSNLLLFFRFSFLFRLGWCTAVTLYGIRCTANMCSVISIEFDCGNGNGEIDRERTRGAMLLFRLGMMILHSVRTRRRYLANISLDGIQWPLIDFREVRNHKSSNISNRMFVRYTVSVAFFFGLFALGSIALEQNDILFRTAVAAAAARSIEIGNEGWTPNVGMVCACFHSIRCTTTTIDAQLLSHLSFFGDDVV